MGKQVVFVCQQTGPTLTWRVVLPGQTSIERSVLSSQVGTKLTFQSDPGFGFEIHILSSSSSGIISELRVTAVRQLNGVTVECRGGGGTDMSNIQIASVGECVKYVTVTDIKKVHLINYGIII